MADPRDHDAPIFVITLGRRTHLATRAALAAGKDAAKRLAGGLLSGDEESTPKDARRPAVAKSRRNKLIAVGIFGLLIVLGVLGLVVSYWHWFLLLGALGLLGLYGVRRIRNRFAAKGKPEASTGSKAEHRAPGARAREDAGRESALVPQAPALKRADRVRDRPRPDASAREKAQAVEQQEREIDEELATLKARLDQ
jgi:hypothetical protein